MDIRVAAYAVVTDDDGRVLLARWTEGARAAWTMPGGGLDPGEDPADAVLREVFEETGYRVVIDELLGVNSRVIPAHRRIHQGSDAALHTIRIIYRAHVVGGTLTFEADGSTDMAGWFELPALKKMQHVNLVEVALRMAELR